MTRQAPQLSHGTGDTAPRADGRTRLLDAAEELMAEQGPFAVSLREINAAAGHKNGSGLQYHFGGREGLIKAVVERHMSVVDARRNEVVDDLEREGQAGDVRMLVRALIEPIAERLASPSGRRYVRILLQLKAHIDMAGQEPSFFTANRSLVRVGKHIAGLSAQLPPRIATERIGHFETFVLQVLATRAGQLEARRRMSLEHEVFVSNLVDVLVAVVTAPASKETLRLMNVKR
jgi:AcrR family transcriptional regulator